MCAELTHSYKLHIYKLGLDPDCSTVRVVLMSAGPEPNVREPYWAYVQVHSDAEMESMPSHSLQEQAIELLNSKQLPLGPIYNLFEKELDTLSSYLEVPLKQGWIRPLKSPTGALVFFKPKKDGSLWLYIDY
jgi:hypothetical protein